MPTHRRYWRGHPAGIWTIETAARWVLDQAHLRGLEPQDYIDGICELPDMGITVENAVNTLKPLMPFAHFAYNDWSGRAENFETWEAWYNYRLYDRIRYFFHKHRGTRTYRCWGEWPSSVPRFLSSFNEDTLCIAAE